MKLRFWHRLALQTFPVRAQKNKDCRWSKTLKETAPKINQWSECFMLSIKLVLQSRRKQNQNVHSENTKVKSAFWSSNILLASTL